MNRPRVLLLNLSGIGFCSTSKMAARTVLFTRHQSTKIVGLFQYSDWLSRYLHLK